MEKKKSKSQIDMEWKNRKLCSDPACIGVIGPNGRCKECGRPHEGSSSEDSFFEESTSESEFNETETEETPVEDDAAMFSEETEDTDAELHIDWKDRTLCSDPACIGVIGSDGCCKECGKPYEGK